MSNQIYLLHEKSRHNFKIGSTCNFVNRIGGYITPCDYFDNSTHFIILYDINSSQYTCYQLDWIIQQLSTKYSYPFVKLVDNTGGCEFYKLDDFNKLDDFFNNLNIKFTKKQINIDEFRKSNKQTHIDSANVLITDYNNFNSHSINSDELESIAQSLNIVNKHFQLKQLQLDIRSLFSKFTERFSHLIISPTGTGKTVIFTLLLCDYIIKHKKDVMIITKKKEILSQLPLRINNYIKSFVKSKIINNFDYEIMNCVNECSTEILNNKSKSPQIYIVNWDKFTSSSKTNYLKVKWNKFGFVIIDESHWVGANAIFDVMSYIKEKTSVNYIGFSATPIRCSQTNQTRILDIFGNKKDYSIFYEYSYYQALINKDICPIKYQVVEIETSDLVDDTDDNDDDIENNFNNKDNNLQSNTNNNVSQSKILSQQAYLKVWNKLNTQIISKTNFKKGIFWFRSRSDLLKYYIWANANIKDIKFIPTISVSKADNQNILNLVKKADLTDYNFDNAISQFIDIKSNCVLLSVFRFVEGSDDDRLEFGVKMFYSTCLSDPLNESQKMGRFSRWFGNDPNGVKKCGYYASLEISGDLEQIKKSLINRFKSWISFVRSFSSNSNNLTDNKIKTKDEIQKEIKLILDLYVDIDTINTFQIDIQSDIINSYTNSNSDITKISNALKIENSKRNYDNKIDTKSKYDVWAIQYGYPSCDELIESGFNDFTKLFNLDSQKYLSWSELKKLCKEYQNKYSDLRPIEIYNIMKKDNKNLIDEPEEIYKNKFTCFNDLF
jgi:hypothetical protein